MWWTFFSIRVKYLQSTYASAKSLTVKSLASRLRFYWSLMGRQLFSVTKGKNRRHYHKSCYGAIPFVKYGNK
jgi:hypothetical protein